MSSKTPLEKSITKGILARLNSLPGCRAKKYPGGMMGGAEVDIYGCINGRAFFLEVKRPGEKATPRQESILRAWSEAGAITGVVTSTAEAVEALALKKPAEAGL